MNGKNIIDLIGQSKKKLENYTKKEIIEIISNTQQEDIVTDMEPKDCEKMIEFLDAKISDMEKNIVSKLVSENEKLTKRCNDLEYVNNRLVDRVAKIEKNHWQNVQYSRRNNLEFVGIPSNISQDDLEDNVIEILKSIDVSVLPEDIEACHRLEYGKNESKDNPKRTIVKFVNRKICENSMKNRKQLKNTDKTELGYDNDNSYLYQP